MATFRDLELRHLIALDAVADAGTFGRAAERLGYTQSAVSQQIAALEKLLGEPVFDRPGGPRPVELTPLGEHLLAEARDLLARAAGLWESVDRFRTGEVGRLTIGTFQSASTKVLPRIVGEMVRRFPDVEIRVVESDVDDVLNRGLASGELDLSFVVGTWTGAYESVHLFDDPFVLVARPGDFAPGPVPISVLFDAPMVGQNENSCQLMNEQGLRAAGVDPDYVFRTNDNGTVTAMVKAGLGLAVQPLLCVEPGDPGISLHPLQPPLPDREVAIAWRSGRTLSPIAEQFIEIARSVSVELESHLQLVG
jgi:DNA-binding transcriptional LysR family regulator